MILSGGGEITSLCTNHELHCPQGLLYPSNKTTSLLLNLIVEQWVITEPFNVRHHDRRAFYTVLALKVDT